MIFTVLRYVGEKGDWFSVGNQTEVIDSFVSSEGGRWFLESLNPCLIIIEAKEIVPAETIAGWLGSLTSDEGFDPSAVEIDTVPCDEGAVLSTPNQVVQWVQDKLG